MPISRSLFALCFVLPLVGCGSGTDTVSNGTATRSVSSSATEAARSFLEAIDANDQAAFTALLTEDARAALEQDGGMGFNGDRMDSFELGAETIEGDEARVSVEVQQEGHAQAADLLLRKESDQWRVWGMHIVFGDGGMTLDFEAVSGVIEELGKELGEQIGEQLAEQFEQAFDDMKLAMEQGGTVEEIERERDVFESLAAVSSEDFDSSWRIDLDGRGRTAQALLQEVLEPVAFGLDADEFQEALSVSLSMQWTQISRIEAIERIATEAGLHPIWPNLEPTGYSDEEPQPATLTFAEGPRELPSMLSGPFLVEVLEVEEQAPRPTGTVKFGLRALGLAPSATAYQTEMGHFLRVDKLRNAKGEPLADEEMQYWGTPKTEGNYLSYTLDRELTGLLRSVEEIDVVSGAVLLTFPIEMEELELEQAVPEQTSKAGVVTVSEWAKDVRFEIVGSEESLEHVSLRMSPRKASGDPLGTLYSGSHGWGKKLKGNIQCPEPPAAVDLKLCKETSLSFPFELRHIPLKHFQKQPERIEALTFQGSSPLRASLVGGMRRDGNQAEVTLSLANESNKDALSIQVKFIYLDSKGSAISDFPHTLTGDYDFETQTSASIVGARKSIEKTSFAAFLPDNATSVGFEVQSVEFHDGTSWEQPD